ncbi:MAG TPA: NAD(P)/FAD-dependent oxidoreductase [Patescibacteria group bacterium]|nr:NAD(P)/FAD-dependent oxidoreductase [Patescibacteria group bacterium]
MKTINTIVIGAGQSGLSVSYFLTKNKVDHLVLERGQLADEIRNRRWDAFHLITPNHMTRLPGFPYIGKDPNGFDSRDEVVAHLEKYAKSFKAPVAENAEVLSVTQSKNGFVVKTKDSTYESRNVVVAIGSFHKPIVPEVAKLIPKGVTQLHSSQYKNSKKLPTGSVLVVGGGNSGVQIAVDLKRDGREVYLSLGRLRIVPRNYRGKDFMEWAEDMGALDRTTDEATPEIKATLAPLLYGYGGTVNIRKLAEDGIRLVGKLKGFENDKFLFDKTLNDAISSGEAALVGFKAAVDKYIADKKLNAKSEAPEISKKITYKETSELNLKESKIKTVIWATGFEDDFSFLKVPVFDKNGEPVHEKGVSTLPGFYFMGLRWLSKYKSFLLVGVAEDAEYISGKIK